MPRWAKIVALSFAGVETADHSRTEGEGFGDEGEGEAGPVVCLSVG